jgi:cytoskeletal protein CcmA (bactofilin family)
MFGRKDVNEPTETVSQEPTTQSPATARSVAPETARAMSPASPMPARRPMDLPHSSSRRSSADRISDGTERKLTVGKGLSLSGEIASCDVLVVEGKVEAKLTDGKLLEIAETGQFRGGVEIENADIAGRYDGELTVHGRLTVRGTGRISGIIKYGELEVSAGGQIIGEMQVIGGGAQATSNGGPGGRGFKNAAKFTAQADDEDDALFSRKAINT